MHSRSWKRYESSVSAMFGGKRALMKGTKEKADIVNLDGRDMPWVIDAKLRTKLEIWTWMRDLVKYAEKTGRPAILVFREFSKRGSYAVVEKGWFMEQFDEFGHLWRWHIWSKDDRDTFPAAMAEAKKLAGDNKIPILMMKQRANGDVDYVCIRAANLKSMMICKGLINLEE